MRRFRSCGVWGVWFKQFFIVQLQLLFVQLLVFQFEQFFFQLEQFIKFKLVKLIQFRYAACGLCHQCWLKQ